MRPHQPEPLTLTVEQVAARLGISRAHAYDLAQGDRLPVPVIRLGRRLVMSRAALDQLLAREVTLPASGSGDEAA